MKNEDSERVFSLSMDYVLELQQKGATETVLAAELLKAELDKETPNKWMLSRLSDFYSVSYKLLIEIDSLLEYGYIDASSENQDEWKVIMSKDDMSIIETIAVARFYTVVELKNHGNISVEIH
tara:strand:- start:1663 stop:2031 length:369 start_codon:yes stop_codon:yes gene_type:complete